MAEPAIILAFNVSEQSLIVFNGSVTTFESLRRGRYPTRIYLRKSNPTSVPGSLSEQETSEFDASAFDGLNVGFWQDSPGTNENQISLTSQLGWTYTEDDDGNKCFEGYLELDIAPVAEWLGDETCDDCYFAVDLVKGTDLTPVYDFKRCGTKNFEIQNRTNPGSGIGVVMTTPVPRIPLPCQFGPDTNGKIWAIDGIAGDPPQLLISCINP